MSGEFCDTNIVVYAYDRTAGSKHERAADLLARLWDSREGVLSVQILQETFVSLRKTPHSAPLDQARSIVAGLLTWRVMVPAPPDVLEAIDASQRWQISFWDAMVLVMANKAGATVVWTEDLNHGQRYGDVVVQNPFLSAS